jgi:hypothetical protein
MSTSAESPSDAGAKWFVEEFNLRSPIEEFQEHTRLEIDRLRNGNPKFNESSHRQAAELVLRKLRPERMGGKR